MVSKGFTIFLNEKNLLFLRKRKKHCCPVHIDLETYDCWGRNYNLQQGIMKHSNVIWFSSCLSSIILHVFVSLVVGASCTFGNQSMIQFWICWTWAFAKTDLLWLILKYRVVILAKTFALSQWSLHSYENIRIVFGNICIPYSTLPMSHGMLQFLKAKNIL